MIDNLPTLAPDAVRSARTLARCRQQLQHRERRATIIERALVTCVGTLYLLAAAADSLRVYMSK